LWKAKRELVLQAIEIVLVLPLQKEFVELVIRSTPVVFRVVIKSAWVVMSQRQQIILLLSQEQVLFSLAQGKVVAVP
jgi:hypothetical protein